MMAASSEFHGWRVVGGTFVLAVFGWGIGFYGPPILLQTVREARGWSLELVSAAVTLHFLFGALVVANLPGLYRRFGVATITAAGSLTLALGLVGWAFAAEPWQLFLVALVSGAGWVTMGAAAVNAIVAPWFVRQRPKALVTAYNGASMGGVICSPLLVVLVDRLGFLAATAAVGIVMVVTVWLLAILLFSRSPEDLGQVPDGPAAALAPEAVTTLDSGSLAGRVLWRDRRFVTLALGMALGLFAQIGLLAHLFSLLVPALGSQRAGLAMGLATLAAIGGRTLVGFLMPAGADRRLLAAASYGVQMIGVAALIGADGSDGILLALGVVLFGAGIGNATSLPPLVAQAEFAKGDVARVVPLVIAVSQMTWSFAPLAFGLLRRAFADLTAAETGAAPHLLLAVLTLQALAAKAFLAGRGKLATKVAARA